MTHQPPGRSLGVVLGLGQGPDQRLDLAARKSARTQKADRAVQDRDHRRLEPHRTGPAIKEGGRRFARLLEGVLQGSGARAP